MTKFLQILGIVIGTTLVIAFLVFIQYQGLLKHQSRQAETNIAKEKPIAKIGVLAPLTGDNSEVGENVRNIILEYVKENAYKYDVTFDVIIEDDGFKVRNIAPLTSKLINVDKVDGLITTLAYSGMAASVVARNHETPHINVGSNQDVADAKYNFLNYTPIKEIGKRFIELFQKNNVKSFALVYMDHVGPATYIPELKKVSDENGITYKDYSYVPTEIDFKQMLYLIKQDNPDMIVFLALPPSLDILGKQIKEAGIEIPLTSVAFFSMSNNKYLFEGFPYIDAPDGTPEFVAMVNDKLKTDNMFLLAFAQDTIKIYMDIIDGFYKEHNRLPTRKEIAQMIRSLKDFEGEVGTYSMKDGITQSQAVFKKIINGKATILEEL